MSEDLLKKELAQLLEEKERRLKYDKFHNYYFQDHQIDDNGHDISRSKYPQHVKFMAATKDYRELGFIAPNRSGKSETGSFITTALVMKDYPAWWQGKRFPDNQPLEILVLGKTNLAVRDVAQKKLLGSLYDLGTGMIPKEAIVDKKMKPGVPDAVQDLYIRDKFGCINHIQFLSYEIDDDVVMGRELHMAWFDEECLRTRLYNEILMRTMTTKGFVFTTFTPLDGITEGILRFMPEITFPEDGIVRDDMKKETGRFVMHCGWDSAPHLSEEDKIDMRRRYTGAELLARTQGIPSTGEGHIYTTPEEQVVVEPFPIPDHWPRHYGLDVGWNYTAAVWVAVDPESNVEYTYSEHYGQKAPPAVHASAIKARGSWIIGAIDPASAGSNQADGKTMFELYEREGLLLIPANNTKEAGIAHVNQLELSGQSKIFSTCKNLIAERRLYTRDEHGQIKRHLKDHALDARRYAAMTGINYGEIEPDPDANLDFIETNFNRNSVTGY